MIRRIIFAAAVLAAAPALAQTPPAQQPAAPTIHVPDPDWAFVANFWKKRAQDDAALAAETTGRLVALAQQRDELQRQVEALTKRADTAPATVPPK